MTGDFRPQNVNDAWHAHLTRDQRFAGIDRSLARLDAGITLRDYRKTDLREVVTLDEVALKGFMKTRLAAQFKAQYYSLIGAYPRSIFVVAERAGNLVGFVAGYVWPSEFQKYAAAHNQSLRFAALPALLRRPLSALRLSRESGEIEAEAWSGAPIDPARTELAIVVVHPESSGRGIGRRLVQEFVRRAAQKGAAEVRLTTSASGNDRANRFFRSLGFELVTVLGDGTRHPMNEYRLVRLTT